MQQDAPLPRPPTRSQDNNSPSSAGSDWSGMSNYNGNYRPDAFPSLAKGDSISPYDADVNFDPRSFHRANTFAGVPAEPMDGRRGISENGSHGSRASSRAASSRTSDISLRDPQSRRYARAESELRQHYAVLRAYLKGTASRPGRSHRALDKLLRLTPLQFHELSVDVFDELQRRQAAAPLPGRPPRQDKVPPFLQPRPDYHEKRNHARKKLSTLPTSPFRNLCTDMFCELEHRFPHFNPDNRRESTASQRARSQSRGQGSRPPPPPFGMPLPGGPGPNGYRPPSRAHTTNGSVSSQGYGPRKGSAGQNDMPPNLISEYGRPTPKQFQSNTVMPIKSTMVEDDDDHDNSHHDRYDRSSDAFGLDSSVTSPRSRRDTSVTSMTTGSRDVKSFPPPSEEVQERITDLEQKLRMKDLEIRDLSQRISIQQNLQDKLDQVENLNRSLKEEIERIRHDHASTASQKQDLQGDPKLRNDHEQLQEEHLQLKKRYDQQLQQTTEVSKQFKAQLVEMRALADESSGSMQREEKLHVQIQRLQEEAAEWKARYTRAKTQLRDVRVSTIGLSVPGMNGIKVTRDQTFFAPDGLIRDVHMTKFQLSIDELLHIAREKEVSGVVDHMKEVVTAVRGITGDIELAAEGKKPDEATKKREKLKGKVTATANNVITASKNYAAAQGLSPVSLLDAAASHLTAAVMDLARFAKIRPSSAEELADNKDEHMTPVNKNGYFPTNDHARQPSAAESVYSALSEPTPEQDLRTPLAANNEFSRANGNGVSGLGINTSHQDDVELEELKIYLGNQTDVLVQTVQALVGSVRNGQEMAVIRDHAGGILDLIETLLSATEGSVGTPSPFSSTLEAKALAPFQALARSKNQLEQFTHDLEHHGNQPSAKEFVQKFPPLAFQIAREAKDLTAKIEEVVPGVHTEHEDFS